MDHLLAPGFSLATLLEEHFSGELAVRRIGDEVPPPPLRARGWLTVEAVCVGSDVYCLLRRIRTRAKPSTGLSALTTREYDAVRLASHGASTKEIAHSMGISASTVGVLLWRAYRKVGVADRAELSRIFIESRSGR